MNNLLKLERNCAVGSTEFMQEVFKQLNKEDVGLSRNSDRLPLYLVTTLKEAQKKFASDGKKLFIKPRQNKLFSGLVLDGADYTSIRGLDPETPIIAYDAFKSNLITEWRIYVHRNKMVDSRNYSGDFTIPPDYDYVREVIKENKSSAFPLAYTIDMGVLEQGENHSLYRGMKFDNNVVVEFNDMWAIGNYGMPNDLYLELLKDRYYEILNYA
jgi:hypothetical protein